MLPLKASTKFFTIAIPRPVPPKRRVIEVSAWENFSKRVQYIIKQSKEEGEITPIFVFPPEQIDPKINKYFSNNLVQFMIQSLKELKNLTRTLNIEKNVLFLGYKF